MKLIIAVVRPFVMDRIVVAFEGIENFPGMTVSDIVGFGMGLKAPDAEINPFKLNKRIEIAANNDMVEQIVAAIRSQAHTGKRGDGVIVVLPVEDAFSI